MSKQNRSGEGLAVATPSLDAVYVQLKRFKAQWQAAQEPMVAAMAFDVHKAFDNVRFKMNLYTQIISFHKELHFV
jgi:hypothetical protein